MEINRELQIFTNEEIRDILSHTSSQEQTNTFSIRTIIVNNELDTSVTLQFQASRDLEHWFNVDPTWNISTKSLDYKAINYYFPYIRCVANCSEVPTSGSLSVWLEFKD